MAENGNGNGSRGYWITICGAIAAFAAVGTAIVAPIYSSISDLHTAIVSLSKETVSRNEHLEFKQHIDDKITTLDRQVTRIEGGLVPREEHATHWAEFEARQGELSARITEVQKEFGSNYTQGDVLKDLQRQVAELRAAREALPSPVKP